MIWLLGSVAMVTGVLGLGVAVFNMAVGFTQRT